MSHRYLKLSFILFCTVLWGCTARTTPAPVTNLSSGKTSSQQKIQQLSSGYKVKRGETLYSIAFRADMDFRELAQVNNIQAPYTIFPGQLLHFRANTQKKKKASSYPKQTNKPTISQQKNYKKSKKQLDQPKQREYGQKHTTKKQATDIKQAADKIVWQWPVKGTVSRTFSNKDNGYKGIYIINKANTAVTAAANGTVVYAGNALRGYGNLIIVKHNDDYLSAYAHNDKLLVKEKQDVKVGQKIAEMGRTDETSIGLRFEIRFRGKSVNPVKYLPKH
ncbi:lipoprotein NlpD [Pseudoalteromonas ulvae UL12]|uniref:peptidoglycan DD-metalloendopeptidase family protein n=1 Tax=Pseudoalteromonas ulvae TaxID=107327 RepID=UPI00186B61FE|nr:peptidoglycan DD-metalloendopeptidase family protein [Pseudoalteromonas ulvae]MBE0365291.1 lipoprotein NlpD [Pseudoalteromonas ulvae UL12]